MIKAVVFDLDGTLTKPFLNFKEIREAIGAPFGRQSLLDHIDELDPVEAERALAILTKFEDEAVDNAELNDGARELVDYVASRGLAHGVVTRNSDRSTFHTLERLGLEMEHVITRDSGLPIKPDPAPLLRLIEQWGVTPEETLMVGDFRYDIECGKAAGAMTCMVTNGRQIDDDGGPDHKVSFPSEVVALLEKISQPGPGEDRQK